MIFLPKDWVSRDLGECFDTCRVMSKTFKYPTGNYMIKVHNRNTTRKFEICSKLTMIIWCLYFWLWSYFVPCCGVSIANFEQLNASWEYNQKSQFFLNGFSNFSCRRASFQLASVTITVPWIWQYITEQVFYGTLLDRIKYLLQYQPMVNCSSKCQCKI